MEQLAAVAMTLTQNGNMVLMYFLLLLYVKDIEKAKHLNPFR